MALISAQDIINQALRFSGEITDVPPANTASEYRAAALDYLNRIYLAILSAGNEFDVEMGEPFPWAVAAQPGVFAVEPAITNSVTISQGSTSGVFATAPVNSYGDQVSVAGRYIKFDNMSDVYRVVDHVSGATAFTIDFAYIQSDQSAAAVTMYKLDYTLSQESGILRLTTPMRIYQIQTSVYNGEITGSDIAPMLREYPMMYLQCRYPDRFCVKSTNSDNDVVARINTNPPDFARVEYDYVPYPEVLEDSEDSIPVVPKQYLMVMAYGVAHYVCTDKNDNRADGYMGKLQAGLISMVKAAKKQRVDVNRDRGRLVPRRDLLYSPGAYWWWGRW